MNGRQLHADARLAPGDDGEGEADDVDPALQQLVRHLGREAGVTCKGGGLEGES